MVSTDGLRQHAGDPDGRFESGAPRESAGHEPHRGDELPAAVESVIGLRSPHGPRPHGPRSAALPALG